MPRSVRPPSTPPRPLSGAESLPSCNPHRLFPRSARGPADGPRCLRAEQPLLPPPARHPPAQVPTRPSARPSVRASVCPSVRRSRPRALRAESREVWGAARGSGPRDRGSEPRRRVCSGGGRAPLPGRIGEPLPAGAAARELRAWKRRTYGPSTCQAATSEHEPRGPAPRALIRRDPVLPQPWALRAGGAWPRRRCWWPWPRCWWALRAICIPERVSLGSRSGQGAARWGAAPRQNGALLGTQNPLRWGAGGWNRRSSPAGGGKPLTLAFALLGSRLRSSRAGPGLEEPSPSARPTAGASLECASDLGRAPSEPNSLQRWTRVQSGLPESGLPGSGWPRRAQFPGHTQFGARVESEGLGTGVPLGLLLMGDTARVGNCNPPPPIPEI